MTSQWPGGFTGSLAIANLGDPITAWTLKFSFTAGQQVTSGWNGTFSQSGGGHRHRRRLQRGPRYRRLHDGRLQRHVDRQQPGTGQLQPQRRHLYRLPHDNHPDTDRYQDGRPRPTPTPTRTSPTPTRTTAPPTGGNPPAWPTATGSVTVTATIKVSGTYDGQLRRYTASGLGSGADGTHRIYSASDTTYRRVSRTAERVPLSAAPGRGLIVHSGW